MNETQEIFEIQKILVINLDHITIDDYWTLQRDAEDDENKGLIVDEFEYGLQVYTFQCDYDEHAEGIISEKYSEEFKLIFDKARSLGCEWIKFDEDGPTYDGFELFN